MGDLTRMALLNLLNLIKEKLVNEEIIENISIARGMDHWGIIGGELLEKGAQLSNHIRGMRN